MHEGQVVALEVVLDDELPVAVELELEAAVGSGGAHPLVLSPAREAVQAAAERLDVPLEGGSVAAQVHEHQVHPHRGANRLQAVGAAVEALVLVPAGAADVRGPLEPAVQTVGPRVVGATDAGGKAARLAHELVAAVAAHVVEDADFAVPVAHHEHRLAEEVDRAHVAGGGDGAGVADAGPGRIEQALAFEHEECLGGVGLVRQSGGANGGAVDVLHQLRRKAAGGECGRGERHGVWSSGERIEGYGGRLFGPRGDGARRARTGEGQESRGAPDQAGSRPIRRAMLPPRTSAIPSLPSKSSQ